MSAFKTILVPVADAASGAKPLDTALALAGRFASHVTALHVRPDPTTAVPLVGEGMSGAMVEEMITLAEGQAEARAREARALFDAACAKHGAPLLATPPAAGLSAEWVDVVGREEDMVCWRGRLTDLLVFGRPAGNAEATAMMTLNTALMAASRPLLLCPDAEAPLPGDNIAIAWNGSTEAARAVGGAMPLLAKAKTVAVLCAAEQVDQPMGTPAAELAAYLAWQGIAASITLVQANPTRAGEELLRQAAKAGADLLVMGAYTHSRLRQLILGGVTRHVITHSPIPVLLCH